MRTANDMAKVRSALLRWRAMSWDEREDALRSGRRDWVVADSRDASHYVGRRDTRAIAAALSAEDHDTLIEIGLLEMIIEIRDRMPEPKVAN